MYTIGILGGVASGKSLVAEYLKERGAHILDGDRAGHDVLRQEDVREAIRHEFGDAVLDADGQVNRRAVAKIVFAPTDDGRRRLAWLEALTHPKITLLLKEQMASLEDRGARVAVLDAPVMMKAGWHRLCDAVWFVDAPRAARLLRAKQRGWSEEDFRQRELAQESVSEKRRLADVVIDNSGPKEATKRQIDMYFPMPGA